MTQIRQKYLLCTNTGWQPKVETMRQHETFKCQIRHNLKDSEYVEKLTEQSRQLRTVYQTHWRAAREFLTFFDKIRFCRYPALLYERAKSKSKFKNERLLVLLRRNLFGNVLRDTTRHILKFQIMTYLTLKVSCCRMVSTLGCHPVFVQRRYFRRI